MSTKPRTPVHWPKMKVRGGLRKWLSAQRVQSVVWMPHARLTVTGPVEPGQKIGYTFTAASESQPGTHAIKLTMWRDGWGRPVKRK